MIAPLTCMGSLDRALRLPLAGGGSIPSAQHGACAVAELSASKAGVESTDVEAEARQPAFKSRFYHFLGARTSSIILDRLLTLSMPQFSYL